MSYPRIKNFEPMKIPTRKNFDSRNTHEKKCWTHKIAARKSFRSTKYPREKIWTHEIPRRKDPGPTKCPSEKILNPQRHGCTMTQEPR